MSIKTRLLSLIISALIVGTIVIIMISDNQLKMIIDSNQNTLYSERLDTILGTLQVSVDRLHTTGQVEAYIDDFKESAVKTLRKSYYHQKNLQIFPLIIDSNGQIIMRPQHQGDDILLAKPALVNKLLSDKIEKSGTFELNKRWYIFKHFSDWDWIVLYTVPREAKYAHVYKFRNILILIMAVITTFSIIVIWLIIFRITKPIAVLAKGTKAIANGDYSLQVDMSDSSEIGQLARDFNQMAIAINSKIADLNIEIDERKKAESALKDKERLMRLMIEKSPLPMVITDKNQDIEFFNDKFIDLFGYTISDIATADKWWQTCYPDEAYRNRVQKSWAYAVEKAQTKKTDIKMQEWEWTIKDGSKRICEFYMVPLSHSSLIIMNDITAKRKSDEQIKASLKEKETLLQEIHHRVKNNMQVISGLLKLQADNSENEQIRHSLRESQSRVYAMSAVHETIYSSRNLTEINLNKYLSKIINTLTQAYLVETSKISCLIESDEINISIDQATPLGLVVNELISNALTHAFPQDTSGDISVKIRKINHENVEVCIKDTGIGLPATFSWDVNSNLGLQLVKGLVENQLDGHIEIVGEAGAQFIINFKLT